MGRRLARGGREVVLRIGREKNRVDERDFGECCSVSPMEGIELKGDGV